MSDPVPSDFQRIFDFALARLPHLATANAGAIHGWLEQGCSADKDIIPTIARLTVAGRHIASFSYFTQAILDAKAARTFQPAAKPTEAAVFATFTPEERERREMHLIAWWRKYRGRAPYCKLDDSDFARLDAYEQTHGRIEP